jgi:amino acid adenylation domain-containing protein/non-ribosomal peptide synthase protein (TIGR01720 family)
MILATNVSNRIVASFPLSRQQRRIWRRASSTEYCVQTAICVEGQMDLEALQLALRHVVQQDQGLRTTFPRSESANPEQVILDFMEPEWQTQRIDSLERQHWLSDLLLSHRTTPFDLQNGPLCRVLVATLPDSQSLLLLTMSAISCDPRSLFNLFQRVSECYKAGSLSPNDELPAYHEFAAWEQETSEAHGKEALLGRSFWNRQNVNGLSTPLLPGTRKSTGPVHTASGLPGSIWKGAVGPEVTDQLCQAARTLELSAGDLLRILWAILITRLSGDSDLVLGDLVDGRKYKEVENALGPYARCLPLRISVQPKRGLGELAHQLRELRDQVSDWQEYANFSDEPVFPLGFEWHDWSTPLKFGGRPARLLAQHYRIEDFRLKLVVLNLPDDLHVDLSWDPEHFESGYMQRLGERYLSLIANAVSNLAQPAEALPLLLDSEKQQMLHQFNDTATKFPGRGLILGLFEQQAQRTPENRALIFSGHCLNYWELNQRANQVAHQLLALGLKKEERVGILLERSHKTIIAFLGILKAGGAYVPLDTSFPPERLLTQLSDARVRLVLTEASSAAPLSTAHQLQTVIFEDACKYPRTDPTVEISDQQLAYVLFTSGSTGKPKGVQIEHSQLINYMNAVQQVLQLPAGSSFAVVSTFAADLGNTMIYGALCSGGSLHVLPAETASDPEAFRRYLKAHHIDCIKIVPSHIGALLAAEKAEELLPEKLLVLGGEAAPWSFIEKVRQAKPACRILNHYGPTETTVGVLTHEVTLDRLAARETAAVPIGSPLANCRAYLLNEEMEPVPWGVTGELYIGGAGVTRGYIEQPDMTAEKFVPNPFAAGERLYKTGDLGRFTSDGQIEFLGRDDNQVKIHGNRIELGEIEAALLADARVIQSVVLTQEKGPTEKQLAAYVVARSENSLRPEDLRGSLASRLPAYMLPATIRVLTTMPLNANGKIDRNALRSLESTETARPTAFVAPSTEREKILAAIFEEVLRIANPGIHDNFFELGGDSILAIQVVAGANRRGLFLSPKEIFQAQTIAELAVCARNATTASDQAVVTGPALLSPIQRWFFEQEFEQQHHWNQSMLFQVDKQVSLPMLEKAIGRLVSHHDVLRSQFRQAEDGWSQYITEDAAYPPCFIRIDLSRFSDEEVTQIREEHMARIQADLDLSRGPLMRFVLFEHGADKPAWLLVDSHHLVVDGVSWRILIEDLETACAQMRSGEEISLPAKTHSWQFWTAKLAEYARSQTLTEEIPHWLALASAPVVALPRDSKGANTAGSTDTVVTTFTEEDTSTLLHKLPKLYGTQMNDVLLAALARAFARFTNHSLLLLDMEGHGREDILPAIDISRTVGWFTTHYPVLLEANMNDKPEETLLQVKHQLQQTPNKGIGYGLLRYLRPADKQIAELKKLPAREVKFNYLGQLDNARPHRGLFSMLGESTGPQRDEFSQHPHLLDINSIVVSGQFHVRWTYSRNVHRKATIQRLADSFREELAALISDEGKASIRKYSPADFPLARLNSEGLQKIANLVEDTFKKTAGDGEQPPAIVDIYPLSPLQESLLAHCLTAPASGAGFEQKSIHLEGELDIKAFCRTWEAIIDRHPILRTLFTADEQGKFRQVVLSRARIPLEQQDWRTLDRSLHYHKLRLHLRDDREKGFDPGCAPLMRLALIQLSDTSYKVIWSYHHLLLDAWCRNLVIQDVLKLYEAFQRGTPVEQLPSRPYRDYIEWLDRQDLATAEKFWRNLLSGVRQPNAFLGCGKVDLTPAGDKDYQVSTIQFSESETASLQSFARQNRLTLNTLLQGAWDLLLAHLSGSNDVVYGTTVSGRPPSLPGSESILGMFINNLPVRVRVPNGVSVLSWLNDLQNLLLQIRDYEWVSPRKLQDWSEMPEGQRLFESLLVFQNYPVDDVAGPQNQRELNMVQTQSRMETNYPLTLVAGPFQPLMIRLIHDSRSLPSTVVARWGECLRAILKSFVTAPQRFVTEIALLSEAEERRVLQASATPIVSLGIHHALERFTLDLLDHPHQAAVSWESGRLSWLELRIEGGSVAAQLRRAGAKLGDVVAIIASQPSSIAGMIVGTWMAGCTVAILDQSHGIKGNESRLDEIRAAFAIAPGGKVPQFAAWQGRVLDLDPAPIHASEELKITDMPVPESVAWLQCRDSQHWLAISHQAFAERAADLAGFCRTHNIGALLIAGNISQASLKMAEALAGGVPAIIPENEVSSIQAALLEQGDERTIGLQMVSGAWRELIQSGWNGAPQLFAMCSSPIISKWLIRELESRSVSAHKTYLREEISSAAAIVPLGANTSLTLLGRPARNTEIHVLTSGLQPAPTGIYGEIYVSGTLLPHGYWDSPGTTAEQFIPNPFTDRPGARLFRTGDIARWNEDGSLEYGGSLTEHSPTIAAAVRTVATESALLCHPELCEVAVTTWEDMAGQKKAVAYIVADPKSLSAVEELCEVARKRISRHWVPELFVRQQQLPAGMNGRCNLKLLPSREEMEGRVEEIYVAAADAIEVRVRQIWEQLFNIRPIGVREDFFELGGHSMLAVCLIDKLNREFDRNLPVSLLMQNGGTIEHVAWAIREQGGPIAWSPLVRIQPGTDRPPVFCVHAMGGDVFCYLNLAHYMGQDQPFYGLQSRGWGGEGELERTVQEMAATNVAAIRKKRPHGPYILAGWSFGGMIALEMAHQFRDSGESVAMLAILDTNLKVRGQQPLPKRLGETHGDLPIKTQQDWAKIILRFARPGRAIPEEELRQFERVEDQITYAIERGVLPPALSVEAAMCYVRASAANTRARDTYVPQPYPGPIVLFRAMRGHVLRCPDPTLGWQEIALGGLEIIDAPGEHDTFVERPYVEEVARRFREYMDRICSSEIKTVITVA